jgi:DNA-binding NarL/FixJ family response regulator
MVQDMTSCPGRQIYLIGANMLHNELLANCVTDRTGAICKVAATLDSVPPATDSSAPKRLVLYDFRNGRETLEDLIASDTKSILKSDYLVLMNISPSLHIECEALQAGVRGFLYHQSGVDTLLKMIHSVLNSELWVSRDLMAELFLVGGLTKKPNTAQSAVLTPRELDILRDLARGLSNAMIADNHCLSPHTVKNHIYHIFKKINVCSRLQAAQWASQHL